MFFTPSTRRLFSAMVFVFAAICTALPNTAWAQIEEGSWMITEYENSTELGVFTSTGTTPPTGRSASASVWPWTTTSSVVNWPKSSFSMSTTASTEYGSHEMSASAMASTTTSQLPSALLTGDIFYAIVDCNSTLGDCNAVGFLLVHDDGRKANWYIKTTSLNSAGHLDIAAGRVIGFDYRTTLPLTSNAFAFYASATL